MKNLRSQQKIYATAGRTGRDKYDLWRHDQIVKVRPVVIPLTLASVQDFQRLEEAAHATKRYLFRFQHNNQAALKAGLLRIYQSYNLYSINSLII